MIQILFLFIINVLAEIQTGTWTTNCNFEYDTIQHKLSITGKDSLSKDPTFFQQHQNDIEFISIGNGFTIIEESAFSDYTSLKRIILPEGLKTISTSAFQGCKSLESIIIPESVTHIGSKAFYDCTIFNSIYLPKGLQSLGSQSFDGCEYLSNVFFGGVNDPSEDQNVFVGDHMIDKIIVTEQYQGTVLGGHSVIVRFTCGDKCYMSFSGLYTTMTLISDNGMSKPDRLGQYRDQIDTLIIIGNDFNGMDLKYISVFTALKTIEIKTPKISDGLFSGLTMESVYIHANVEEIGDKAFEGCANLKNVFIAENSQLKTIGIYAFADCPKLEYINIPKTIQTIDFPIVFEGINSLKYLHMTPGSSGTENYSTENSIVLSTDKTKIVYCPKSLITNFFTIPNQIKIIGKRSFINTELKGIIIPDTVTSIEKEAFAYNHYLETVIISEQVKHIDNYAFAFCNNIETLIIKTSELVFGTYSFVGMNKLKSILIVSKTKPTYTIDETAFKDCSKLSSVNLLKSITEDVQLSFDKSITIQKNLISESCGDQCQHIYNENDKSMIIYGSGVVNSNFETTINKGNVEKIIIEEGIKTISQSVFNSFTNLKSILYKGDSSVSCGSQTIPSNNFVGVQSPLYNNAEGFCSFEKIYNYGNAINTFSWIINDKKELIISGNGELKGYSETNKPEWVEYVNDIKKVTIKEGITTLDDKPFIGLVNVETFELPKSLTSIGKDVFSYFKASFSSINVHAENSVYSSSEGVLFNKQKTQLLKYPCGSKKPYYIIPSSVTSLGVNSFSNAETLLQLVIISNLESIGENSFVYCTKLQEIDIFVSSDLTTPFTGLKESITIKSSTHYQPTTFAGSTVSKTLTMIGQNVVALYLMTSPLLLVIGSGTTNDRQWTDGSLWKDKEEVNKQIEQIQIFEGVTSIGNYLFQGLPNLKSINLPSTITSIGKNPFDNCPSLVNIDSQTKSFVFTEGMLLGNNNQTIITYAASTESKLLVIPLTITSIGDHAFSDCVYLDEIIFTKNIATVGENPFIRCKQLNTIDTTTNPHFHSGVGLFMNKQQTELISYFYWNQMTEYILLSETLVTINSYAFFENKFLTMIVIPRNLRTIKTNGFYECTSLNTFFYFNTEQLVTLENTNEFKSLSIRVVTKNDYTPTTFLGFQVFKMTPNEIQTNQYYSFDEVTGFLLIHGTGALPRVTSSQFYTQLMYPFYLYIDDGITSLTESQFDASLKKNLTNITQVFVSGSVTTIGAYPFWSLVKLHSARLSEGIRDPGSQTFSGCWELQRVEFPNSVKTITTMTFWKNYNLRRFIIPKNATTIEDYVFSNCAKLEKVVSQPTAVQYGPSVFHNSTIKTFVHFGSVPPLISETTCSNSKNFCSGISSTASIPCDPFYCNTTSVITVIVPSDYHNDYGEETTFMKHTVNIKKTDVLNK